MYSRDELQEIIDNEISDPLTGRVGVHVEDLDQHETLFSNAAEEQFLIASLTKMFIAGAALQHLGDEHTFITRLAAPRSPSPTGVLDGDLFVVGGGDPTLGDSEHVRLHYRGMGTPVQSIVERVIAAGVKQITGNLASDGSLFSQDSSEPSNWISALPFNRTKSERPVLTAAELIANSLRLAGVRIEGGVSEIRPYGDLVDLGYIESPPVRDLAIFAGHESDNFVSEVLTKHIGSSLESTPASTAAGCAAVERYAKNLGANITLLNGSGIRVRRGGDITGNVSSPRDVVHFLRATNSGGTSTQIEKTLPRAGQDGTLKTRMRNTSAVGSIRAKTGTLTLNARPLQDALAGYCRGPRANLAFAFIYEKSESRFVARSSLDRVASALAAYCGTAPTRCY